MNSHLFLPSGETANSLPPPLGRRLRMIHGAQIVEGHGSNPGHEERVRDHAKAAEEYISQHGHELGLKMVKYIYGEEQAPSAPHDTRRKWSHWEI